MTTFPVSRNPPACRVMIAHADDLLRRVLTEEVEELGYAVESVATGTAAIIALERHPIGAVLIDAEIGPPGLRGVLAAGRTARPDAPFIVLLRFVGDLDVAESGDLAPFAYLRIPIAAEELESTLALADGRVGPDTQP